MIRNMNLPHSLCISLCIPYPTDRGDILEILITRGGDVNVCDIDDWSPLLWAASKGFPTCLQVSSSCQHNEGHNPWVLRFLNGAVLRNLNMYSFQKLCPVCSATCLSDALKPKKFRKYLLII